MKYTRIFTFLCSISLSTFCASKVGQQIVSIASAKGIIMSAHGSKSRKKIKKPLLISAHKNYVTVNGKKLDSPLWHLLPRNGVLSINDITYYGPSLLHVHSSGVKIITRKKDRTIAKLTLPNPLNKTTPPSHHEIKALIYEHPISSSKPLTISGDTGFMIYDPQKPGTKKDIKNNTLTIKPTQNSMSVNGNRITYTPIRIISKSGCVGVDNHRFHGSLSIVKDNDRLLVINHVDLENYVCSVLKTESWPGWPLEVNKAFAIASRSYALATMKKADTVKNPYHIKNTNAHQTYYGVHADPIIRQAVEQTRSMCLMHKKEPALAMFDSCCGGVIPAHIADFDFEKVPYLARTYPCKHCKRCRIYSWKSELRLDDINKHIAKLLKKSGKINDFKIAKKDKAGLVRELHVKQGKESHTVSGKQLYGAMKDIKSFCYNVERKKDTFIFSGRGFGHHIGICQWGAREMVRDGWSYKRILNFYYPGTTITKLT